MSPRNDHQTELPQQDTQQTLSTEQGDPKEPIQGFDWDELEKRFHSKMVECKHIEDEIYEEFNNLLEVSENSDDGASR